jgi:hypothetical protein
MANEAYWLDDFATLDLETGEATPTSTPVAGIQNVTIIPSVSVEQLYTGDSIKIDAQKQHEFSVDVSIGYSKWDPVVAEQWLGGGGGTSANSLTDTSDPQKYQITGEFDSVNDNTTLSVTVEGITFEEMPIIDASRGEYVQWDLEGVGEDMTDLSTA